MKVNIKFNQIIILNVRKTTMNVSSINCYSIVIRKPLCVHIYRFHSEKIISYDKFEHKFRFCFNCKRSATKKKAHREVIASNCKGVE